MARLERNIAWSYVNWLVAMGVPLVMVPIYLGCLGNETYGLWLVILSVTSYLSLANLGIAQTLANRIAEAAARKRGDEIGPLVSTAFFGYGAIAAGLFAALRLFAPMVTGRLAAGTSSAALAPFFIYVTLLLLSFPFKVFPMVLRGFERVDQEQAIAVAANVVRIAALALALFSGLKLKAVAAINGGAEIASSMAAYGLARRLTRKARPRLKNFSGALLGGMVRPSLGFLGIQVATTLMVGVDNLVVGWALGAAAVTAYAVPMRLTTMAAGPLGVAVQAVNPSVTVNYAQGSRERLGRGFLFSIRVATLYASAGAIALWVIGPAFLRAWAGPGVFPGWAAYALMVALFVIVAMVWPASSVLWATTRHYTWAKLALGEGVVNLGLSLWGVRHFGLSGVIGATVATSLMMTGWYLPYGALSTLGVPIASAARELGPGLVVSAAALAAVAIGWHPYREASLMHASVWGAAAVLGYAIAFLWLGFNREQRESALGRLLAFAPSGILRVRS